MDDSRPSRGGTAKTVLVIVFLAVIITTLIGGGFWWVWPYHPMEITSLSVTPPQVRAGDRVTLTMAYCKHTRDVAETHLFFMNGMVTQSATRPPEPLNLGCDVLAEGINAPEVAGKYKVNMERTYRPAFHPARTERQWSNEFEVLPAPAADTVTPEELRQAVAPGRVDLAHVLAANRELIRSNAAVVARADALMVRVDAQARTIQALAQQFSTTQKKRK